MFLQDSFSSSSKISSESQMYIDIDLYVMDGNQNLRYKGFPMVFSKVFLFIKWSTFSLLKDIFSN